MIPNKNPKEIADFIDEQPLQMQCHPDYMPIGEHDQEEAHVYHGTNPNPYADYEQQF